jgi:streptogramin lyase
MSNTVEYPERHTIGHVMLHDLDLAAEALNSGEVDFGLKVADDGRVWVCIDGRAFLRFKPSRRVQPSDD